MSNGLNQAMLIGHLGADPELRLATSRKWNDKHGELQEETQWHRVVVWDRMATNCHRYLQKGSQVYVDGRIQHRKWTDKQGQDRWTAEVVARNVVFLGSPSRTSEQAATAPPEAADDRDPTQRY